MWDFEEDEKAEKRYTVYQRYDNGTYAIRFTIKGYPQFRFGLKTRDEELAHKRAQRVYDKTVWGIKDGLSVGFASFSKIAKEYLEILDAEAAKNPAKAKGARYARSVVETYLIPNFKNQDIATIQHKHLMDYLDWRRVYWTEGDGKATRWIWAKRGNQNLKRKAPTTEASVSTLRRETSIIRGVFKLAVRKGFLRQSDIPKIDVGRAPLKKRPSFTRDQYHHLILTSIQRIQAVPKHKKQRFERMMLHGFITVAAETGMRTMEMFNLNWGHIEGFRETVQTGKDTQKITVIAQGKGKQPQRFHPRRDAIGGFEHLYQAQTRYFGKEPDDADPVFINYKGDRMRNFTASFKALLKAADLETDAVGHPFSAYCFRHSYATWALQKSVDIYKLAINMRTSVEMIERYYSDVIPDDYAAVLRGDAEWD